jgi:multimeric flavodoxin WrbA
MKIMTLLGSPRSNGNSAAIAGRFLQTAESLGAETKTIYLNKLKFRGCQACMACKGKLDHCALDDDLTEVLNEIHDTDVLVLASPVYFGDITAQMKMFIDRTYSYYVPDFMTQANPSRLPSGKKMIFIQAQGQPIEKMFDDIYPKYELFFQFLGFKNNELIRACGVNDASDAENREDILTIAEDAARRLMEGAA